MPSLVSVPMGLGVHVLLSRDKPLGIEDPDMCQGTFVVHSSSAVCRYSLVVSKEVCDGKA